VVIIPYVAKVLMTIQNGFDLAFSMFLATTYLKRNFDVPSSSNNILHIRSPPCLRGIPP